jgi:hypothetical protein
VTLGVTVHVTLAVYAELVERRAGGGDVNGKTHDT